MTTDILIKNGHVLDPIQGINEVCDIAIKDGIIVPAEEIKSSKQTINAKGCWVTPGLIDYHVHTADKITEIGIPQDTFCFASGVTTVVDAGSTGVANYEQFRSKISASPVRTFALLNVSSRGLETLKYHEDMEPEHFDADKIRELFVRYKDQLIGIKLRISKEIVGELKEKPLLNAIEIAETIGCPVEVHTTNPAIPAKELASMLRPGDIYAHVYQGRGDTILENDGQLKPEIISARKRGVIFDAANGGNHFAFSIAGPAIEQAFLPDIISTDLTTLSLFQTPQVFSLPFVLSKYLAMGLSLESVFQASIQTPARLLGKERELGSLCYGTCADVAVHKLVECPVTFSDSLGQTLSGTKLLRTEMTVRDGVTVFRQIDFGY